MRDQGSLVAHETGQVTSYAIESAQERGVLFVRPGEERRGRWEGALGGGAVAAANSVLWGEVVCHCWRPSTGGPA